MKRTRFTGKRWLAMALSLIMCFGLLQVPAMAAEEGSTLKKSAFENAVNLGQGDTCYGIVTLDGDPITDSGTPNVWASGMWGGSKDVTGYNWVHITNSNPGVAEATYTTDGGKLSITFTPGTKKGTTSISVGVDTRYPHDQLGTTNMELNFDYSVTNLNGELDIPETPTAATITKAAQVQVVCLDTPQHIATYTLKANPGGWTASAPVATDDSDEPFTSAGIKWKSILTLDNEYWVEKYNSTNSGHVLNSQMTGTVTFTTYWYNNQWTFNTQEATRTVYVNEAPIPSYTYSLTYDGNGGTVNGQGIYTAAYSTTETSYSFNTLTAVRDGYQFKGWASTKDNADAGTADITWPVVLTSAAASKTVYAVWEADAPTHSVTRGDDGSMILMKRFTGTDMPESFFMYYEVTNAASGEIYKSDILTFTKVANGSYRANVTYPTWEFSGEWTMEEKQAYNSIVEFTEYGTEVDGKVLTITAAGAVVDQNEQTVTYTVDAQSKNVGMKTIINTYSAPVVPNKQLTGFTKTRLTSVPAELGLTGINTDAPVNLKVGEQAILLYAITVTGDEGANYTITDPTATPINPDAMSGTIGSTGEATVHVTKTITIDDVVEGYVENAAYVEAGVDTEVGGAATSAIDYTRVNGEMVAEKDGVENDEKVIDFTVVVTNKVGATLSAVRVTDIMQKVSMITDNDGNPIYTIKLYTPDNIESIPNITSAGCSEDGRRTVWTITDTIAPDARIVLTYKGRLDPGVIGGDEWHNDISTEFMRAQNPMTYAADANCSFVEGDWVISGTAHCEGVVK